MRQRNERGVASAHVLAIALILMALTTMCLGAVLLYGLKQKANQGADFAALAASQASVEGARGCQAAKRLARANGVDLVSCRMDADVATVTARASMSNRFGSWGVKSRARAAPDFYFE